MAMDSTAHSPNGKVLWSSGICEAQNELFIASRNTSLGGGESMANFQGKELVLLSAEEASVICSHEEEIYRIKTEYLNYPHPPIRPCRDLSTPCFVSGAAMQCSQPISTNDSQPHYSNCPPARPLSSPSIHQPALSTSVRPYAITNSPNSAITHWYTQVQSPQTVAPQALKISPAIAPCPARASQIHDGDQPHCSMIPQNTPTNTTLSSPPVHPVIVPTSVPPSPLRCKHQSAVTLQDHCKRGAGYKSASSSDSSSDSPNSSPASSPAACTAQSSPAAENSPADGADIEVLRLPLVDFKRAIAHLSEPEQHRARRARRADQNKRASGDMRARQRQEQEMLRRVLARQASLLSRRRDNLIHTLHTCADRHFRQPDNAVNGALVSNFLSDMTAAISKLCDADTQHPDSTSDASCMETIKQEMPDPDDRT